MPGLIKTLGLTLDRGVAFFRDRRELAQLLAQLDRTPRRVVVGASGVYDEGWLPTEASFLDLLDPAEWEAYFGARPIDAMLAEHVWEHLTPEQGVDAARTCFRFLRPGGYLRAAVPDGNHPDPRYIAHVRPGGSGKGSWDHKLLYTYRTFAATFEAAGFEVELLEYFDERGAFQRRDWDPAEGRIQRSARFDQRNREGELRYTSIVLDARKPIGVATHQTAASPG